jgi:hypothetical protein
MCVVFMVKVKGPRLVRPFATLMVAWAPDTDSDVEVAASEHPLPVINGASAEWQAEEALTPGYCGLRLRELWHYEEIYCGGKGCLWFLGSMVNPESWRSCIEILILHRKLMIMRNCECSVERLV